MPAFDVVPKGIDRHGLAVREENCLGATADIHKTKEIREKWKSETIDHIPKFLFSLSAASQSLELRACAHMQMDLSLSSTYEWAWQLFACLSQLSWVTQCGAACHPISHMKHSIQPLSPQEVSRSLFEWLHYQSVAQLCYLCYIWKSNACRPLLLRPQIATFTVSISFSLEPYSRGRAIFPQRLGR